MLYKATGGGAGFKTPNRDAYVQQVPDWRDGEYWGPFDTLITFIGQSSPEVFRNGVERVIDVDNVIDFEILLELTGNVKGPNYNLFLARGRSRCPLFHRPVGLRHEFPQALRPLERPDQPPPRGLAGYSRRVAERWRHCAKTDCRSGPDAADRRSGGGTGRGVDRNYRRWPNTPGETWEGKVGNCGPSVEHLRLLDAHFATLENDETADKDDPAGAAASAGGAVPPLRRLPAISRALRPRILGAAGDAHSKRLASDLLFGAGLDGPRRRLILAVMFKLFGASSLTPGSSPGS